MKTIILESIKIGLFSSIIFASCSKKDITANKSQTELLTQKSWKFEVYGLDENNNGIIEASENGMLDCEADDVYTFNANGTGVYSGGALECSIGESPSIDFGWTFSNNGTELAIFAAPEKINKLDENILEVYYIDQNSEGLPVKYIRRFEH